MVTVMSTEKSGRAVIEPDLTDKLKELGDILGHTSLSQTINYILRQYIEFEITAARRYQQSKYENLKDYKKLKG